MTKPPTTTKPLPKENTFFERLMRPLSAEEFEQLSQNVLADMRVIQPLVVWKETGELVDGYHRIKIIKLNPSVVWSTQEISFPDQTAAVRWILGHQLGRRNLSGGSIQMARVKLITGSDDRTLKSIAEELSVSPKTIQRAGEYGKLMESVPEDIRDDITQGRRSAGAGAMRKLFELDEEQRQRAYARMRENPGKPVHECLPVLKKPSPASTERTAPPAIEGLSASSARKISSGGAVTPPDVIERFESLSPTKQMVVDDVIATGGSSSLKEAMAIVETAPKRNLPPDADKIEAPIEQQRKLNRSLAIKHIESAIRSVTDLHAVAPNAELAKSIKDFLSQAYDRLKTWDIK